MSETKKKGAVKRGRKAKVASTISKQRTLKDMFGSQSSSAGTSQTSVLSTVEVVNVSGEPADDASGVSEPEPSLESSTLSKANDIVKAAKRTVQPVQVYPIFQKCQHPPRLTEEAFSLPNFQSSPVIDIDSDSDVEVASKVQSGSKFVSEHLTSVPSSLPSVGRSRDDPIVIEQSPEREVPRKSSNNTFWSIFRRPEPLSSVSMAFSSKRSVSGTTASNPTSESQHVRGSQSTFTVTTRPFPPRGTDKGKAREIEQDSPVFLSAYRELKIEDQAVLSGDDKIHVSTAVSPSPEEVPSAHKTYPAIARLCNEALLQETKSDTSDHLQWVNKYRPRRADEVLGNEERAQYLRDWLVALRLQYDKGSQPGSTASSQGKKRKIAKIKRPNIIRQVQKRRRIDYDDLDSFVAPDEDVEEVFEDSSIESEDDLLQFLSNQTSSGPPSTTSSLPSSRLSSPAPETLRNDDLTSAFSAKSVRFGQNIHNTILLTGGNGIGKTAAVYACAEELGWEVFEVYSGIGPRNGPELHRLVGDVGKHHLVNARPGDKVPSQIFESSGAPKKRRQVVLSDDEEHIHAESTHVRPEPIIKQSLLLIEEVDVLYQTDTGFWPALINIIKECRRPVVLTCNDRALIPFEDLPLQATLVFESPPGSLAVSYLQAICEIEGRPSSRRVLRSLYEGDLRRSIQQLQIPDPEVSILPAETHLNHTQVFALTNDQHLGRLSVLDDIRSFVSCQGADSPHDAPDAEFIYQDISADNELGHNFIGIDNAAIKPSVVSAFHMLQDTIAEESARISRLLLARYNLPAPAELPDAQEQPLLNAVSTFTTQMIPVFEACRLPLLNPRQTSLYLDYTPWIRHMVGVDDAIHQSASPLGQSRRQTRNSRKTVEQRYMGHLRETELERLTRTAFPLFN